MIVGGVLQVQILVVCLIGEEGEEGEERGMGGWRMHARKKYLSRPKNKVVFFLFPTKTKNKL